MFYLILIIILLIAILLLVTKDKKKILKIIGISLIIAGVLVTLIGFIIKYMVINNMGMFNLSSVMKIIIFKFIKVSFALICLGIITWFGSKFIKS